MSAPKHWFTAAEMADIMGVSHQRWNEVVRENGWREPGRMCTASNPHGCWKRDGGKTVYHYTLLPSHKRHTAALQLAAKSAEDAGEAKASKARLSRDAAWERWHRMPDTRKDRAKAKLKALLAVRDLVLSGMAKDAAVRMVGAEQGFAASSFYGWEGAVAGVALEDWLPYLLDHYAGRQAKAEVSPEAWEMFLGDYLRPEEPGPAECYNRLKDAAKKHGWTLPSLKTLMRKVEREVPRRLVVLRRKGADEHDRLYPPQIRDRSGFHALQALNYDGHKLDLFVKWRDQEKTDRAYLIAFQDLCSNKIVGWRIDRAETADAFRLAFGDVVEKFGIPDVVYSDNTMAAAAKANTGGTRFRHRYKVKDDDFEGLFPAMGVDLRFTRPAHGQSKPIERGFGDLARYIAKAPECAGAYTGNSPDNKPANYGAKAVALDVLKQVCEREIARYNARADRNSAVAQGRSFDDVFNESYALAPVRKLSGPDDPLRLLLLLAVEGVTCRRPSGAIQLYGNVYWSEHLVPLIDKKVAVRFDPDDLHRDIHVYRLDGSYVGAARCQDKAGFADRAAAKDRARAVSRFRQATRQMEEAAQLLDAADVAKLMPGVTETPTPAARVVRPAAFKGPRKALSPIPQADIDARFDSAGAALADLHEARMRRKLRSA